jgi:hypothetical protein
MDLEHYASVPGTPDGYDVPRLSPPLRLVGEAPRVGGMSGAVFPFLVPRGAHGIDFPDATQPFDVGTFFINTMVRYLATDGRTWQLEACAEDNSCAWLPQLPVELPSPARSLTPGPRAAQHAGHEPPRPARALARVPAAAARLPSSPCPVCRSRAPAGDAAGARAGRGGGRRGALRP